MVAISFAEESELSSFAEECEHSIQSEKKWIIPQLDESKCDGEYFFRNGAGYIVTFCIEDIKKECISQQKKLSINSCDITEENLYTDFLNEKKSEDILFNLLKNGRFSLTKDEKKLKKAFWAKYKMHCHHGGTIGEGVFSEDNVFLYEQVLDLIW